MVTIKLEKSWTYRTPEKTITFPAGEHEVFKYIAEQAEAEGVIPKEEADAGTDSAPAPRKARAAHQSEG